MNDEPNFNSKFIWLFRIVLIVFPIISIFLIELFLRAIKFGDDLRLFIPYRFNDQYLTINLDVGKRYFSEIGSGSFGTQDVFLKEKSPSTKRIFALGGSSMAGYPYMHLGAFPAMIKDRLIQAYPNYNIEMINLGMTAVTSFTVLDFIRDVLHYDPDLIILYTGHNEFYGALGTGSTQSLKGSRFLTLVYLKLRTFKILQLVKKTIDWISRSLLPSNLKREGTLMERMVKNQSIPYDSKLYRKTIEIFEANIHAIIEASQREKVPLLMGSVVSNIRDQEPFISVWQKGSPIDSLEELIARSKDLVKKNNYVQALQTLNNVIAIDSTYALAYFLRGKCFDLLGEYTRAKNSYVKARDYDGLRFRASSEINHVLKKLAKSRGVYFADIEESFEQESQNSIIGKNLIIEHLHPNLKGYFLMAKTVTEVILQNNLLSIPVPPHPSESDEWFWDQTGITPLDKKIAEYRMKILLSGWPFKKGGRVLSLDFIQPTNFMEEQAKAVVSSKSNYEKAHVKLAEYYRKEGQFDKAILEYKALAKKFPINESPFLKLGRLLVRTRRLEEALPYLLRATELIDDPFSYKWAGTILIDKGEVTKGASYLEHALTLNTRDWQSMYNLSGAYFLQGDTSGALKELEKLLKGNPNFPDAQRFYDQLKSVYTKKKISE